MVTPNLHIPHAEEVRRTVSKHAWRVLEPSFETLEEIWQVLREYVD